MARNNNNNNNNKNNPGECVTFWGAVGANLVGGLIVGTASAIVSFIVVGTMASRMNQEMIDQLRREGALPPAPQG